METGSQYCLNSENGERSVFDYLGRGRGRWTCHHSLNLTPKEIGNPLEHALIHNLCWPGHVTARTADDITGPVTGPVCVYVSPVSE